MPNYVICSGCGRRFVVDSALFDHFASNPTLAAFCEGCVKTLCTEDRQSKAEYERELRERYELPTDHPIGGGRV